MSDLRLADLHPQFLQHRVGIADEHHGRKRPDGSIQWGGFEVDELWIVESIAEADGIVFDCPKCTVANGGPCGTHAVQVFFQGRKAPDRVVTHNAKGEPVRWTFAGTGYADLTIRPSILLLGGCGWHGFITSGVATNA